MEGSFCRPLAGPFLPFRTYVSRMASKWLFLLSCQDATSVSAVQGSVVSSCFAAQGPPGVLGVALGHGLLGCVGSTAMLSRQLAW